MFFLYVFSVSKRGTNVYYQREGIIQHLFKCACIIFNLMSVHKSSNVYFSRFLSSDNFEIYCDIFSLNFVTIAHIKHFCNNYLF